MKRRTSRKSSRNPKLAELLLWLKELVLKIKRHPLKVLSYIWVIITVLAVLYGLLVDFSPQISIEKLLALNKNRPFSVPFRVYNHNFFDLHDIKIKYHFDEIKFDAIGFKNMTIRNYNYSTNIIQLKKNHPLDIPLKFKINFSPLTITKFEQSRVDIFIKYKASPLKFSALDTFSFNIELDGNRVLRWFRIK